ncbi:NDK-domain-containing protein [Violaceomyces palustris]|uniref:NDK-domain-containing protein n=1 Tax=Violaceomyces palustris TaxID=1673888 RepID=A0ACD0NZ22_9BASI|nr:NDK-domain-containing protein [Violaceomyces palustris]
MFARSAIPAFRAAAARTFSTSAAPKGVAAASASRATLAAGAAVALAGGALTYNAFAAPSVHLEGPKTIAGEYKTSSERSFIMIKPDGTSRQIVGDVIKRFEQRGYKLVAIKSLVPSQELAKEHYIDLASRPFYPALVKYITCGTPVIAMVWEGKDIIRQGRRMVGATNPLEADPGSIRGQYCISVGRNIIHASDAFDSATKEIGLWFDPKELADYEPIAAPMITAEN